MVNPSINIRMDENLKRQLNADGDVPNAETVEAIREVKKMKADPSFGKTYSDVDQMMEDLLADV